MTNHGSPWMGEKVVGVRLSMPTMMLDGIELKYAAVLSGYRRKGVYPGLMKQVFDLAIELDQPLHVEVRKGNQSDMLDRLQRYGFKVTGETELQHSLVWVPNWGIPQGSPLLLL